MGTELTDRRRVACITGEPDLTHCRLGYAADDVIRRKICGTTARVKRCERCYAVAYCGREHQKADWKVHKKACVPREGRKTRRVWKESATTSTWFCRNQAKEMIEERRQGKTLGRNQRLSRSLPSGRKTSATGHRDWRLLGSEGKLWAKAQLATMGLGSGSAVGWPVNLAPASKPLTALQGSEFLQGRVVHKERGTRRCPKPTASPHIPVQECAFHFCLHDATDLPSR
ncbi:MYND finger domain-containing protein [Hirsutella rhossiliensis]